MNLLVQSRGCCIHTICPPEDHCLDQGGLCTCIPPVVDTPTPTPIQGANCVFDNPMVVQPDGSLAPPQATTSSQFFQYSTIQCSDPVGIKFDEGGATTFFNMFYIEWITGACVVCALGILAFLMFMKRR